MYDLPSVAFVPHCVPSSPPGDGHSPKTMVSVIIAVLPSASVAVMATVFHTRSAQVCPSLARTRHGISSAFCAVMGTTLIRSPPVSITVT